ncbi:MAG: DUF885 domain-containing protein, partial [Verrucomicrobiota bacterium]|nr:DUF885 domain-containing protein [Verrucomicrobiota bacterium]
MKLRFLSIVTAVAVSVGNAIATPDDDRFQKLAADYIEQHLQTHPEEATQLGDHRFDDRLTDYSPETRTKELAAAKAFREKLNSFGADAKLTGPNGVDLRILKDSVDYQIFDLEELKDEDWNSLAYNQSLANGLYLIVAREFDSPEKRIPNLRRRMEGIPAVIAQAKANLKHSPKVHTETAIDQIQGAIGFVREGLNPLLDRAPEMKKELAPLQEKTALALEDYRKWLQEDLLPRSDGDFRLGMEKF